jgi:hypothetical protein
MHRSRARSLLPSAAVLAIAGTLPAQLAGSYLVDPAATPPNFPSLQAAATAAMTQGVAAPVDFVILPGVYTESVTLSSIPGASSVNTVTFRSIAPSTVRLFGSTGDTFALSGIATARTGWIVFDGLDFDSAPGWAISGTTYVEAIEVRNCTFGPNHRPLTGTRDGIIWSEGSGTEIGWRIHHNHFTFPNRLTRTTYGIYLSNGGGWSFRDNTVDLNGCNYGLYLINQNRRLDVVYNNVFYGALFASTSTSANSVAVIKADISNYDNDFVHNTFLVTVPGSSGCIIATRGLGGTSPATNRIHGNVFALTGTGTCIVLNASTSLPQPYVGDGNVFWCPAGEVGRMTPTGPGDTTLAGWQVTTGQDLGSVQADPLFRNAAAPPFDLRVLPGSPAHDRALNTPSYVVEDRNGWLRDAQPDAGAYESLGFATFGQGCAGTGSLMPQIASTGAVALGAVFTIDVHNAFANAPALSWGGFSRTSFGGQQLPYPLGGGCAVQAAPEASLFLLTDGTGSAQRFLVVPNNLALLGNAFYFQWGVLDPGSVSPLGLTVSNGGAVNL